MSGAKNFTVARSKKNNDEWRAEMLPWWRSDGLERLIVVEASMGGTNYTFRLCASESHGCNGSILMTLLSSIHVNYVQQFTEALTGK
jgi:hypothetical protein